MIREPIIVISVLLVLHKCSGSALHGKCEKDHECGTFDSHCRNGTCACIKNFMAFHDTCIQVATPHQHCRKRDDCHKKLGPRSFCRESKCACKPFHHIHKAQCIKDKELFVECEEDHQCYCGQNCWQGMACINSTCTCKLGYKPSGLGRKCVEYHPEPQVSSQHLTTENETGGKDCLKSNSFLFLYSIYILFYSSLIHS